MTTPEHHQARIQTSAVPVSNALACKPPSEAILSSLAKLMTPHDLQHRELDSIRDRVPIIRSGKKDKVIAYIRHNMLSFTSTAELWFEHVATLSALLMV